MLVTSTAFGLLVVSVEVCRLAIFVWALESGGLRRTARPAVLVLNTSIEISRLLLLPAHGTVVAKSVERMIYLRKERMEWRKHVCKH